LSLSGFSEEQLQKMNIREFKILKKSGHNIKEALATKKGVTGEVTVEFPRATHSLEQHTIPLLDKAGEIVSIMAVYNDLTGKLIEEAKREELANYITAYLSSMADNLTKLAKGNLDFNLEIAPSSKTTEEARQWFTDINKNLADVKGALDLLVSDAHTLSKAAVEGKLDSRADVTKHQGDYRKIVDGVNITLDAVIGPLNVAAEYVDRISKGDIPARITDKYNGDFNEIKNNLNSCIDAINGLQSDLGSTIRSLKTGDIEARCTAKNLQGVYQGLAQGVNEALDNVIAPVVEVIGLMGMYAKGDLAQEMRILPGKQIVLTNGMNGIRTNVMALVVDMNNIVTAAVEGKLDTRADASKHQGDYRKIVEGVNATLDAVIGPLNVAAEYVDRISKGDIPPKISDTYKGDFNEIKNNLNACIDVMNGLLSETDVLIKATKDGKLDTRGNAQKFPGGWGKLVGGVNDLIDAFVHPINVTAEYVDRISKGDFPQKITDNYNGDFNEIKNNLNACIDGLQGLVEANVVLARMANNDHSKGVEGTYQGVFAETKTSVNLVRDRSNHIADMLVKISDGDLTGAETLRKAGKRSDADRLVPAFIRTFDALQALTNDTGMLTKAAVEGKLKTRADVTKHQGDYRKIVEGVNNTLDSVINPVNEAMRMANEFAKCNFTARVDENLHVEGDFIKFKEALNSIGTEVSKAMSMINQQVMELASSAQEANASIEEVSSGAEQIAKNAAGVSTNAERGNEGIAQVLRAMEDLNQTVTEVAQKAEKVSQLTEDANTLSVKGTNLAEQAERGMQSITTSSSEVEKIIIDIKAEMDKIGKIVGLISDLANQTNLLALNAAIEAARAGEAGRGFAVVATEVKSLAQESRASAENIADMIGTLQKKSIAAGEAVASSNREVKTGSEALAQTLRSFKDIAKSIEDISKNVVEVASVSEEQAATVEEVTASVNEVHGMVQATAKDAMDSAAAAEEASASIDQITKVMGGVNTIVNNVSKEMAKFKV
ncbi:MAG: methyl-accepting chemotaxis protein, partial [Methanomicrobiales archaeon]|nr:methyl-accepting chemotaxis protein [Methanomicrobiales archaeon]